MFLKVLKVIARDRAEQITIPSQLWRREREREKPQNVVYDDNARVD